jgi:hypothetical protein
MIFESEKGQMDDNTLGELEKLSDALDVLNNMHSSWNDQTAKSISNLLDLIEVTTDRLWKRVKP